MFLVETGESRSIPETRAAGTGGGLTTSHQGTRLLEILFYLETRPIRPDGHVVARHHRFSASASFGTTVLMALYPRTWTAMRTFILGSACGGGKQADLMTWPAPSAGRIPIFRAVGIRSGSLGSATLAKRLFVGLQFNFVQSRYHLLAQ